MSTVRILLEVHSTGERTPQELADIAAGRLTSCLGVDQSVQEPVKGRVIEEDDLALTTEQIMAMQPARDVLPPRLYAALTAQNRPRTSYDDLRSATPMEVLMQRTGHLNEPDAIKPTWWQRVLVWL